MCRYPLPRLTAHSHHDQGQILPDQKRKGLGDSRRTKPWKPFVSHTRPQAVPRRTHTTARPVRPCLLCQVVRGRRPTFAPSSAYDGVRVSHGDAVTPALILAKCGPSISTLDCRLSVPRALARHPRLPPDGSPADPPPRFLLRPLHPPVCDPRTLHFSSHSPFQYLCYYFASATCLPFADLYGGAACTCLGTRRRVSRCGS